MFFIKFTCSQLEIILRTIKYRLPNYANNYVNKYFLDQFE